MWEKVHHINIICFFHKQISCDRFFRTDCNIKAQIIPKTRNVINIILRIQYNTVAYSSPLTNMTRKYYFPFLHFIDLGESSFSGISIVGRSKRHLRLIMQSVPHIVIHGRRGNL